MHAYEMKDTCIRLWTLGDPSKKSCIVRLFFLSRANIISAAWRVIKRMLHRGQRKMTGSELRGSRRKEVTDTLQTWRALLWPMFQTDAKCFSTPVTSRYMHPCRFAIDTHSALVQHKINNDVTQKCAHVRLFSIWPTHESSSCPTRLPDRTFATKID